MNNIPNNNTYLEIADLLDDYQVSTNPKRRDKIKTSIVTKMVPVVKKIARTIARRATDPIEDLIQAGFIGLLKAIDNYSKDKNDNFRVYAGYLIIGEMKHYLRDKLNTVRVPRHIQELTIRMNNFTKTLTIEEINSLTTEDYAFALNTTPEQIDIALQVERRSTTSLEDIYFSNNDNNLSFEEVLHDGNYQEKADLEDAKIILSDVLCKLPTDLRYIVDLYLKENMNQKEIAAELNVSQMAISRRLKKAMNIIESAIKDKYIEW